MRQQTILFDTIDFLFILFTVVFLVRTNIIAALYSIKLDDKNTALFVLKLYINKYNLIFILLHTLNGAPTLIETPRILTAQCAWGWDTSPSLPFVI